MFFFNDTATTEIYTLSRHDALPIWRLERPVERDARHLTGDLEAEDDRVRRRVGDEVGARVDARLAGGDRKSTRLNSSHANISYAVFCLQKKKSQRTCFLAL